MVRRRCPSEGRADLRIAPTAAGPLIWRQHAKWLSSRNDRSVFCIRSGTKASNGPTRFAETQGRVASKIRGDGTSGGRFAMRRPASAFLMVFAILAAGVVGLAVGRSNSTLPGWLDGVLPAAGKQSSGLSGATGPIIYYRNPDGLPDYSLTPKKTSSGKEYTAVRASEDVSFEEKAPEVAAAKGDAICRSSLHRN